MDTRYVLTGALLAIALVVPVASSASTTSAFVAGPSGAMACAGASGPSTGSGSVSWSVGLGFGCAITSPAPGKYQLTVRDTNGQDVPFQYAQRNTGGDACGAAGARTGPQLLTFTETCERVDVFVSTSTALTGTITLTRVG